jgi:4-amino-4-deoxy-L-arabinose transferase-like glycosyltransferase
VRRRTEAIAVAALLALMAALLGAGLVTDGLTNDEVLYIAAARRYVAASDFRLNPTMPPLAKLVIGAGLAAGGWHDPEPRPGEDEMSWSYRFVHEANDAGRLLRRARVPIVCVALLLAVVVWAWAREAAGARAALVAAALVALHPTVLAHGHLATTDLVAATAMLLASWGCWRWCQRPTTARAVMTGLALGAAVTTRLSGWLLAPGLLVLALTAWGRAPGVSPPSARQRATFLLALAVTVPLVIWAGHGFQRQPWPGAAVARTVRPPTGAAAWVVERAQAMGVLPDTYLEGARYQIAHGGGGHPAYLLGERSRVGWRHYFLVAFAVKNTPGFLLATIAGLAGAWLSRRQDGAPTRRHWALPAAVVFLGTSAQRVDIGERYILPVYPYLILLIAAAATHWIDSRRGRVLLAAVLALHALPALAATRGGHLTYFNRLAGGPRQGHRVLLDSNLDWGQDLPRLAAWMRQRGVGRIQLGYHGSDHPARLGIDREDLPGVTLYPPQPAARPFEGVVAVSPNLLLGLFPRLGGVYEPLRDRPPDDRAGIFFIYFLDEKAAR